MRLNQTETFSTNDVDHCCFGCKKKSLNDNEVKCEGQTAFVVAVVVVGGDRGGGGENGGNFCFQSIESLPLNDA
jgi:hypothetical protein